MRKIRGSATIETVFIMAVFLMAFVSLLRILFYEHDKAILSGAAYEVAVVSARKRQMDEEFVEAEGVMFVHERVGNKLLFFSALDSSLQFTKEEVIVEVIGRRDSTVVSVVKRFPITYPEQRLRRLKRVQQLGEIDGE